MTRLDCLNALSSQFTDLTEERIAAINSRIHLLLSSRQRWQLLARKRTTISLSEPATKDHARAQPTEPGPQIDLIAQTKQDLERLEKTMSQLSPDERLILRLRYQHDLTLEEVARHMNLTNPNQARRQIEAAIAKLAKYMES
jgi:RNA polymerase sigma factor (sigma-70 family)